MAWSTGSIIFEEIASVLRSNVTDYQARCDVYRELIPIFEENGAEISSALGSDEAFDEIYHEIYPELDFDDNSY